MCSSSVNIVNFTHIYFEFCFLRKHCVSQQLHCDRTTEPFITNSLVCDIFNFLISGLDPKNIYLLLASFSLRALPLNTSYKGRLTTGINPGRVSQWEVFLPSYNKCQVTHFPLGNTSRIDLSGKSSLVESVLWQGPKTCIYTQ